MVIYLLKKLIMEEHYILMQMVLLGGRHVNRAENGNVYIVGWSRILYTEEDIQTVNNFLKIKELVMNKSILFLSLFLISFLPMHISVQAWVVESIAAIVGFFAAILLGLWGILYYPIKRALKNRKDKKMS